MVTILNTYIEYLFVYNKLQNVQMFVFVLFPFIFIHLFFVLIFWLVVYCFVIFSAMFSAVYW